MSHESFRPQPFPAGSSGCRDILENAGIGVFSATPQGRLLSVNQALARMYGYASPQEMIDSSTDIAGRLHGDPQDRAAFLRHVENRADSLTEELRQVRRDGAAFRAYVHVQAVLGADGVVDHYQGVVTDITERYLAAEALRQSEERYRRITEGLTDYLYTVHIEDGRAAQTTHSPACVAVTGYSAEEFAADPYLWIKMVVPEDRERVRDQARQVLAGRKTPPLEHRIIHKDGVVRWVSDTVVSNLDAHGRLLSYDGLIKDITERKEMVEALRKSEARVRTKLLTLLSPEGDISALDLGDIIDAQALQRLMDDFYNLTRIGSAIVDLRGTVLVATGWQEICTMFHRVHPETRGHCVESDTILSGGSDPGTFKLYKCKNKLWDMATPIVVGGKHLGNLFLGQFFFADEMLDHEVFRVQARQYGFDEQAYLDALDRVPRFNRETVDLAMAFYARLANLVSTLSFGHIKLARAMAEQTQAEEEVRRVNARLERTLAEKDKFFSIIAHDLRSPFIGFLAFIKLMSGNIESMSPEDMQKLAGEMKGNAENLFNLLENLLEWARMQRGFAGYEPQPHSLEDLVRHSLELVQPSASQKGIALQCAIAEDITIMADQPMLNTVIRNLLFNAVKFTGRGGTVAIIVKRDDAMVRVMVRDNGVGMDQKAMSRLFALDRKTSQRGTEGERGTGLGLLLCKEFIEKHGGRIWAESAPHEGTTIFFTLPMEGRLETHAQSGEESDQES